MKKIFFFIVIFLNFLLITNNAFSKYQRIEAFDEFRNIKYFQYFSEETFPTIPLDFPYNDISARLILVCGYSKKNPSYLRILFNTIPGLDTNKGELGESGSFFIYRMKSRLSFDETTNQKAEKKGINLSEGLYRLYGIHKPMSKSLYLGDERDLINEAFYVFDYLEGNKFKNKMFLMIVMPHMVRNNSLYKFDITNLDEAIKDCEKYIAN